MAPGSFYIFNKLFFPTSGPRKTRKTCLCHVFFLVCPGDKDAVFRTEMKNGHEVWFTGQLLMKPLKGTRHLWWSSKTSILSWCIPLYVQNNKPVTNLTQLVMEVARECWKKKTPFLHNLCAFHLLSKRLQAWRILLFEWEMTSFYKTTLLQREPALLCSLASKFFFA